MVTSIVLASLATVLQLAPYYLLYLAIDALVDGTATRDGLFGLALLAAAAAAGRFALWAGAMWISHVAASDVERSVLIRSA